MPAYLRFGIIVTATLPFLGWLWLLLVFVLGGPNFGVWVLESILPSPHPRTERGDHQANHSSILLGPQRATHATAAHLASHPPTEGGD